jgi:hypothetical protein
MLRRFCQKGRIQFWRKVSSEPGSDCLRFFINGVQQERVSGEIDWQQVSFPILWPGTTSFEWRYEKNGSVSAGADTVWIGQVELTKEQHTPCPHADGMTHPGEICGRHTRFGTEKGKMSPE